MEKKAYIITGVLTLAIFLVGFLAGYSFLNVQLEQLRLGMERNELELRNIQLEMLFLNTLDNETYCSYMGERLDTIYQNTAKIGRQLVDSEILSREHFDLIGRRYSLALIQDWIISGEFTKRCNTKRVNVLYFYNRNCGLCVQQGYVLDYLVEIDKTKNIHIYSLNVELNESAIGALATNFNITEEPTIVINDIRYSGFRERQFIVEKFCAIDSNLTFCGQ